MSELPDGWTEARVSDLIQLNPKSTHSDKLEVGFIPMSLMGIHFGAKVCYQVRPWREVKKGYTHFENGDVLLAKITPFFENGKGALVDGLPNGVGAGSTEFFVCRPANGSLLPEYLLAFFKSPAFMSSGTARMTGSVGQKRVAKDFLLGSEIPLPPLSEQKRIADKLEAVLGRVDACRSRLARVPALIKRFRQSVLAAATSGQLTEDWRTCHEIELAENLVARIAKDQELAKVKMRGGRTVPSIEDLEGEVVLPEGWVVTGFDALAEPAPNALKAGPFGSTLKKDMYASHGYKVYG